MECVVSEKGRKTTIKKRFIATVPYFQQLLRVDYESRNPINSETEKKVLSTIADAIPRVDILVISDYNKGLLTKTVIDEVLAMAKEKGKKVIADTKRSPYDYRGADILAPNYKELCLAFGMKATNEDEIIVSNAIKLSKTLNATILVKRSGKGASIADGKNVRTYGVSATDIVNVSGAGDIFVAIVAIALASGKSIDEAVKLSNIGCAKAIARKHPSVQLEDFE